MKNTSAMHRVSRAPMAGMDDMTRSLPELVKTVPHVA
jgi:hypothetical protein